VARPCHVQTVPDKDMETEGREWAGHSACVGAYGHFPLLVFCPGKVRAVGVGTIPAKNRVWGYRPLRETLDGGVEHVEAR